MIRPEEMSGRLLTRVTCSWFHHGDRPRELLHVWLHLDGLGPVRFHTRDHVLELSVDPPHEPYDMDEYGYVTLDADPRDFPLTPFVGQRVAAVRQVAQLSLGARIGVALEFPTGAVRVLALADELEVSAGRFADGVEADLETLADDAGQGLDEQGYIAREGSLDRVPAAFTEVVDAARERIGAVFGPDRLHSAYLYGSVPRGTAMPGVSDLDLLLALRAEPTPADRRDADGVEAALDGAFAQVDGVGILLFGTATLLSELERHDLGWFVACLCTPLLGEDLGGRMRRYRPGSLLARETNGDLGLALPRWRERAADPGTDLRALSRGVARRLVRTGFTLVMPRWGGWTSDLDASAAAFARYYPRHAERMALAARTARTPTADPAVLATLLDDLAPWLAAEYTAVHGRKAPRP